MVYLVQTGMLVYLDTGWKPGILGRFVYVTMSYTGYECWNELRTLQNLGIDTLIIHFDPVLAIFGYSAASVKLEF
jgi:hypothetical protein